MREIAPPLPAPFTARLDRRHLFRLGGLAMLLAGGRLAAQDFGTGFTHGVASGEPGANRVLLWTRYVAAQPVKLRFEIAEDESFARPVSGGEVEAGPERDWCAKAFAEGLEPGRWYYYRFVAPDGDTSCIGRTRTLPDGPTAEWRMAVFSCSNLGFGWFNAYGHAAEGDAFDMAVHLGDYYYEYGRGHYPDPGEEGPDRVLWPANEIVTLADYRLRHATYRADPDLRRLTQCYPMIFIWDDHETANDSWMGGAENHQPDSEGPWSVREAAALRAYREWLPVSDEDWAEYQVGDLATIFRLETRLDGREKQFNLRDLFKPGMEPAEIERALVAFRDGPWSDPKRQLMGARQEAWLRDALQRSTGSGRRWQVLAQQIVMGELRLDPQMAAGVVEAANPAVKAQVGAMALTSMAGLPFNMDSWDGYPAARARLFKASLDAGANLVTLSGDSHNGWANDLSLGGEPVGVEFGGHSVTSPGAEGYLPWMPTGQLTQSVVGYNPGLVWADLSQRGYMAVELTPQQARCDWRFMGTIRNRTTQLAGSHRMVAAHGARKFSA
ncbi:MAG: alkaline phosphatase D family protein [Sphingomonadales bacterium]|nr:alkaline phosphatase D family protein [Sphingomonadales bacterium]MBD3772922.1 alkaline phosphatase D family protein [Paracoccaceae bacterium]